MVYCLTDISICYFETKTVLLAVNSHKKRHKYVIVYLELKREPSCKSKSQNPFEIFTPITNQNQRGCEL